MVKTRAHVTVVLEIQCPDEIGEREGIWSLTTLAAEAKRHALSEVKKLGGSRIVGEPRASVVMFDEVES